MGVVRGILTLALLVFFVGLALWAWRGRRKPLFDQLARLPLEEDSTTDRGDGPS
jgi:cytochrome c oxidase cbb3-type subunit 4